MCGLSRRLSISSARDIVPCDFHRAYLLASRARNKPRMVDDCGGSRSRIDSLCSAASKFTMSASENSGADHQLVRAIGIPGLTANIVNSTIGAGIFALPAAVALQIGAASPVAYIICAFSNVPVRHLLCHGGKSRVLTGGLYAMSKLRSAVTSDFSRVRFTSSRRFWRFRESSASSPLQSAE